MPLSAVSRVSPAAKVYVRPVRVALWLGLGAGRADAGALRSAGERLEDYLAEVASRPRGSAVPV